MAHTLLYFLALFSLSTSPNWAKLNQMPVEVLGFYRLGIAALLVGIWTFVVKQKKWPKLETKLIWILLSGFFFFLHLWTYKFAAKNTTISNTMVLFQTTPLWSTLGGLFFFNEVLSKRLLLSYALALTGIFFLFGQQADFNSVTFKGDLSALLSGFFYAAYMLSGKQARKFYDNTVYATFQYLIGAFLFLSMALYTDRTFTNYTTISWIGVAGLILLPTLLGHFTFTYLVKTMNLSLMTCGKLIEPVLASILAYFIFNETISSATWIAFALTGSSVVILFAPDLRKAITHRTRKAT